jgi:hypothetical protein
MASTSQEFDALDGLVITGDLNVGGGATFDTNVLVIDATNNRVGINKTPTVAFDVSGDVNIDGGTIDGLTQLSVDSLTLNGGKMSSSGTLELESAVGTHGIVLDSGLGRVIFEDEGTEFGRIRQSGSGLKFSAGSTPIDALTLQSDGDAVFAANVALSDGQMLQLGSAQNITMSSLGITFSANTYHDGNIVAFNDPNTHLNFNAADSFQITTGGTVRMTVNNSGVTIPGALLFESVASDEPYYETINTPAALTFNLNNGSAFTKSNSGSGGTVVFTMPSSPGTNSFAWTIKFINSGSLTWPASVKWSEGVQPPESAGTDIYSFVTYDGGTNIYGSLAVRNAS